MRHTKKHAVLAHLDHARGAAVMELHQKNMPATARAIDLTDGVLGAVASHSRGWEASFAKGMAPAHHKKRRHTKKASKRRGKATAAQMRGLRKAWAANRARGRITHHAEHRKAAKTGRRRKKSHAEKPWMKGLRAARRARKAKARRAR